MKKVRFFTQRFYGRHYIEDIENANCLNQRIIPLLYKPFFPLKARSLKSDIFPENYIKQQTLPRYIGRSRNSLFGCVNSSRTKRKNSDIVSLLRRLTLYSIVDIDCGVVTYLKISHTTTRRLNPGHDKINEWKYTTSSDSLEIVK